MLHLNIAFQVRTIWKIEQKQLESLECATGDRWKRSVGQSCKKGRGITQSKRKKDILHTAHRKKATWIAHTLCRNCFLKHVIKWKLRREEETRKEKQLRVDMKEKEAYWNMKEETLARAVWRARCARSYGHLAQQKRQ